MTTIFVVWNDKRITGIPIIDDQHRGILSTMNSLFYFMRKRSSTNTIINLTTSLEQHINIHFAVEENMLRETRYDKAEEHAKYHIEISKKMRTLSAKLRHSGNAADLLIFLKTLWKDHIEVHDMAYKQHVDSFLRSRYDA